MTTPAPQGEYLWAVHSFEAENEDELQFKQGERIRVLRRDEEYGDGWFEGVNTAGEIGLFPQSYTSPDPPSPGSLAEERDGSHTPEPMIAATMSEVQQALDRLQTERQDSRSLKSADRSSLRTKDDVSDDDDTGITDGKETSPSKGMGTNHRAALAAKAVANAEQAAKEEEERAEQRRKDDAAAYEKARSEGLIEGLQMSDESEDEDQLPLPVGMQSSLTMAPESIALPSSPVVDQTPDEPSPIIVVGGVVPAGEEGRPRAETVSSGYAESTYSDQSVPLVSSPPATHDTVPLASTSPVAIPETEDAQEELKEEAIAPKANGDSSIVDTTKDSAIGAVEAVGAGVAGVAAVAAAAVGLNLHSSKEQPAATEASFPKSTAPLVDSKPAPLHAPAAPLEPTPVPSHIVTAPSPVVPPPPSPPVAERATTPPPAALAPVAAAQLTSSPERNIPAPISTSHNAMRSSPAASFTSATRSRSSSRLGTAPLTGGSIATGSTSPRGSASEAYKLLPHDPTVWTVDDVVEWGKAKGFDALTLAKFQEHEISGDVLLEMDVAMLKEIDLVAFGRRVHIYNAIKELKTRVPRSSREIVSPALSGYEPDSPGNLSFASPGQSSFTFPSEDVQGLGLDEDGSSMVRPTSSLARSISGSLQPRRSTGAMSSVPASPTTHRRSVTGDTAAQEPAVEQPIPEEDNETDTQPSRKYSSPVIAAAPVFGTSKPATIRTTSSPKIGSRRSGNEKSDSSAPPSPLLTRKKKDSSSSDRNSFFGVPVGRSRKPPPRVPSAFIADSDGRPPRPLSTSLADARGARSRMAMNSSKRSTRLFGSFGGGSGSEKNAGIEGLRKTSGSTLGGSPRDGPSSMSPKTVDAATSEMTRIQPDAVTDGSNLLERIGTPDYSGWMRKKGEKYNSWKQRFFVLKGIHLYWLKTESEQKVKGFINLRGYRIISDPDVHVGEFGFKIVHDSERPHFFSAAEQVTVRTWMKEIMKATIGRDYSDAVVSSCDMETMPLSVAQTMNPRPRPPSPTERARVQRERYAGTNPNTLTAKDAQILMEFSPGSPSAGFGSPPLGGMRRSSSSNVIAKSQSSPITATAPVLPPVSPPKAVQRATTTDQELLAWVNSSLPASTPLATDLSTSLRSGRTLTRLVENLSGKSSGITDADFDKYRPPAGDGIPFDASYFDTVFNVFDFLTLHTSTDDVSMDDMLSGRQPQLTILLRRIRSAFP